MHRRRPGDRGGAGGDGLTGPGRIAAVVLAAGGSRRLGRPKQLVRFEGEPLVRRAARAALDAGLAPVVVVVAPGAPLSPPLPPRGRGERPGEGGGGVAAAVADLPVVVVENDRAASGMASSVQAGVAAVRARSGDLAGVVLLTCDQPRLDAAHLRALADARRSTRKPVVASAYAGVLGVPALLGAEVLDEVAALHGDAGARDVVRRDPARVAAVPFPGGELDVDRAEDVEALERDANRSDDGGLRD